MATCTQTKTKLTTLKLKVACLYTITQKAFSWSFILSQLKTTKDSTQAHGVTWSTDVIDNEHMEKRSSKACCIFHKPRGYDESDSGESDRYDVLTFRVRFL